MVEHRVNNVDTQLLRQSYILDDLNHHFMLNRKRPGFKKEEHHTRVR